MQQIRACVWLTPHWDACKPLPSTVCTCRLLADARAACADDCVGHASCGGGCLRPPALHEDVERLERVVVKDLKQETKSHRDKLMQSHRVRKRLDQIQESSRKLVRRSVRTLRAGAALASGLARAAASQRTQSVRTWPAVEHSAATCSGRAAPPRPRRAGRPQIKVYDDEDGARKEEIDAIGGEDKAFSRFYDRLKEVREYHRRFPNPDLTEVSAVTQRQCLACPALTLPQEHAKPPTPGASAAPRTNPWACMHA